MMVRIVIVIVKMVMGIVPAVVIRGILPKLLKNNENLKVKKQVQVAKQR